MMNKYWFSFLLMLQLASFNLWAANELSPGSWKFVLKAAHAEIPFIIDFKYQNKKLKGTLQNGAESIALDNITILNNSVSIPLKQYELSLEFTIENAHAVSGNLVRHNKNPKVKTPVLGLHNHKNRFDMSKARPSTIDLSGKWSLELKNEKDESTQAVGQFVQKDNLFTGSILTPTGDYRYLEGYVSGNSFEAASFDGIYNYLFKGALKDGTMEAVILSQSITKVSGKLNSQATLPDAYKQTELKELKFIFPNLKGQSVTLNHPKFANRPVVVQIFGSWCPNCIDEMNFLIPWYNENAKRGIEIIALAFERSLGIDEATKQLIKVQKKYKIPYALLQAGSTAEDKPMDKIVGLKNFIAFPTTIFLNKKHEVVKVHAGFSGPSTGEFFEKWKEEFNTTVDDLLK